MDQESQALVKPFSQWIRYHLTRKDEPETNLAFLLIPAHVNPGGSIDGYVLARDDSAGLAEGLNFRHDIQPGGPGLGHTYSAFPGDEEALEQWLADNKASGD